MIDKSFKESLSRRLKSLKEEMVRCKDNLYHNIVHLDNIRVLLDREECIDENTEEKE